MPVPRRSLAARPNMILDHLSGNDNTAHGAPIRPLLLEDQSHAAHSHPPHPLDSCGTHAHLPGRCGGIVARHANGVGTNGKKMHEHGLQRRRPVRVFRKRQLFDDQCQLHEHKLLRVLFDAANHGTRHEKPPKIVRASVHADGRRACGSDAPGHSQSSGPSRGRYLYLPEHRVPRIRDVPLLADGDLRPRLQDGPMHRMAVPVASGEP
jgi:hypothetical protein